MQTFRTANLKVMAVMESPDRICYVLYPFEGLGEWIEEAAQRFGVTIAVITGMDWDDDLTPWPAAGEPPGSPDFRGLAPAFLAKLKNEVIPEIDRRLGCLQMRSGLWPEFRFRGFLRSGPGCRTILSKI